MWGLRQFAMLPESYHDASQFASLPQMLAYASGLTSDIPTTKEYPSCTHARSKPSLKMRLLCLASVIGLVGTAISDPSTADSYFAKESPIAKAGLLANIGPDGKKAHGAKVRRTTLTSFIHSLIHLQSGIVIASPNTVNPDYLFTWVRDSSLVFKVIADQFALGYDNSLRAQIDHFVTAEAILQQLPNPSGTVKTGGLGEPKFHINETAFTGSWGRPQRGLSVVDTMNFRLSVTFW